MLPVLTVLVASIASSGPLEKLKLPRLLLAAVSAILKTWLKLASSSHFRPGSETASQEARVTSACWASKVAASGVFLAV
jgi:hypothetical protein